MNSITILEFPTNLGLHEPKPGHEPGVKYLPAYLKKQNFHAAIKAEKTERLVPPEYTMNVDPATKVRNADNIVNYAIKQAEPVERELKQNNFCIVLGGDCSVLIGNAIALKNTGNYGLFYLDGHTDFMLPELSQTGGAAGMDLAIVTGYGHGKLTNIDNLEPYFNEENVWCVGNREYDEAYVNAILHSKINYWSLTALRGKNIKNCVNSFLEMVNAQKLDGFWVHIDVDVLDDRIMPAVDSRQSDGLTYEEFNEIIFMLLNHPKSVGIEITILDPELDPTGKYTAGFVTNFCDTFNKTIKGLSN
ncbi:MAG: arginase family protein [Agriterribacter sp.]